MLPLPITVSNTLRLLLVADPPCRRAQNSLSNVFFFLIIYGSSKLFEVETMDLSQQYIYLNICLLLQFFIKAIMLYLMQKL